MRAIDTRGTGRASRAWARSMRGRRGGRNRVCCLWRRKGFRKGPPPGAPCQGHRIPRSISNAKCYVKRAHQRQTRWCRVDGTARDSLPTLPRSRRALGIRGAGPHAPHQAQNERTREVVALLTGQSLSDDVGRDSRGSRPPHDICGREGGGGGGERQGDQALMRAEPIRRSSLDGLVLVRGNGAV